MADILPKCNTFIGEWKNNNQIFHLIWNRPSKFNAWDKDAFEDIRTVFRWFNTQPLLRCVVLTSNGKHFSTGLDLKYAFTSAINQTDYDNARLSIKKYNQLKSWQDTCNVLEECKVPVLVGVHGYCIGAGLDLLSTSDVRYCTKDALFTVKEVDIGIAANLAILQRMPLKCSNDSLIRELIFTGREFSSIEAKQIGLVSEIFENQKQMNEKLFELAQTIAEKSPIAVYSIKKVLNHDLRNIIDPNLEHVSTLNSIMSQTEDMKIAIKSILTKEKPIFAKL